MESAINLPAPLLPEEVIERAKALGAALLADGMKGLGVENDGAMSRDINPVDIRMRTVGTAFTLETENGDNLPIHLSMKLLSEGYVMVIDGKGFSGNAYFGDLIARQARAVGAEAMIIDGCVRDRDELAQFTDFPVYARGVVPNGPYKNGPGEINFPVSVGGQVICPGDILVGDGDSVLVVKPEDAERVAKEAAAVQKKEQGQIADILAGKGFPRPFVDQVLEQIGVEYVD